MKQYYELLKKHKNKLTKQQYCTLKGQLRAGDVNGFIKGFKKVINK